MSPAPRVRLGRPPKAQPGATRRRLLDAALELFAARGFDGTTVRNIARAVGVTDAAIYAHFDSKQALFDALMAEAGPPLLDRVSSKVEELGDKHPADVIPQTFQPLVEAWDQPRARLFTSVLLRHAPEKIHEAVAEVHARLCPVVESWAKRGWLRDDATPELLTWELLVPLGFIRVSLLHANADESNRSRAHQMARDHLAFYVQSNVKPR